jgi:hypothetical protein
VEAGKRAVRTSGSFVVKVWLEVNGDFDGTRSDFGEVLVGLVETSVDAGEG